MLETVTQIIDALGGTKALAEKLGVGASAVSNYRKTGFPPRIHYQLAQICKQQNISVAAHLLGGKMDMASPSPLPTLIGGSYSAGFIKAGFIPIAPSIIQPAAPFIDRLGETMRARLYNFTTPTGEQLCLRPDLTIPTALYHIQNNSGNICTRYCYEGLAFRYPIRGGAPEEFTQAGIEIIGGTQNDEQAYNMEVLERIIALLQEIGVTEFDIIFNQLDMFSRLLSAYNIPVWLVNKLDRHYRAGDDLRLVIENLQNAKPVAPPESALRALMAQGEADDMIIGRTRGDIINRLKQKQEEARREKLDASIYERLIRLADMVNQPADAPFNMPLPDPIAARIAQSTTEIEKHISPPNGKIVFSFGIGRKMAYYTGFMFEIRVNGLGEQAVIASGGRYDDLLSSLAPQNGEIAAVGGAINAERACRAATVEQKKYEQ